MPVQAKKFRCLEKLVRALLVKRGANFAIRLLS
jgi:hypothetical protein